MGGRVSNEVLFLPGFPAPVDAAEDDEAVEDGVRPGEDEVTVCRGQPGNGTLTGVELDADAPPGSQCGVSRRAPTDSVATASSVLRTSG
ncbi:hypothetical protein Esi_0216_0003 [Ectocarpus siliculosus]|uniref:Uncharacterized protein n=1 Tax=Ectocarpus siliculosus TaxID=2880 RepID=D7FRK5_ECTSI|nr:hypothetical protein Esi_0216_0003 [Ectocarpus siliculosus]|eukprot:CBJ30796.1 hypothetical protein Esi_0216_0003 [Ectocarpus siliculosus]